MKDMREVMKAQFIQGVRNAVGEFEKKASYQDWMQNPKFREKLAGHLVGLVKKVKGN